MCSGQLQQLQSLDFSGCKALTSLPESIGELGGLKTLSLSGCDALESVPESFANLKALKVLLLTTDSATADAVHAKMGRRRMQDIASHLNDHAKLLESQVTPTNHAS